MESNAFLEGIRSVHDVPNEQRRVIIIWITCFSFLALAHQRTDAAACGDAETPDGIESVSPRLIDRDKILRDLLDEIWVIYRVCRLL